MHGVKESVESWASQRVVASALAATPARALRDDYESWCVAHGAIALNAVSFGLYFSRLHAKGRSRAGMYYYCILKENQP